ncbi:MAG: hypothetical protein R6X16_09410 [Anaerolineae bacterium]
MKYHLSIVLLVVFALVLSGCQSANNEESGLSPTGTAATVVQPGTDVRTLAMGTLALDGTEHSVDAAQAAELLPLWKAYRALINSDATAPAELVAVLEQIADTLTAAQREALQVAVQDVEGQAALAAEFGLEMPALGADRAMIDGMTEEEVAALRAERQATAEASGSVPGAGVPGAGGGFGMGRGGGVPPTGTEGFVDPAVQAAAGGGASVQAGGGAGTWVSSLVDAVITYLESLETE